MATLTPTLTLAGTAADFGAALSLSVTDSLTVGNPTVGISKIVAPATGGSEVEIKPTGSANQYTYVKHTGYQADGTTATTNQLSVLFGATDTIRLAAEEFAFFPCKSDVTVSVESTSSHAIQVEYAYFTAG